MDIEQYMNKSDFEKIKEFSDKVSTPCLVMDLGRIRRNYLNMEKEYKKSEIYYAVKANPEFPIIQMLGDLGSRFDIASIYELDIVLKAGIDPQRISFGNTIKKASDIRYAFDKGVRLFVTDSENDLNNLITHAPGAKIYIRLLVEGAEYADWPLARKFGCSIEKVRYLISAAKKRGVDIYGLSFHVGSQQRNVFEWEYALIKVKDVFDWAKKEEDVKLEMVNIGGGLPSRYLNETEPLEVYSKNINEFIENHFADDMPRIILEPGRSLVGDSGILVTEIVLISKKTQLDHHRWVYLDTGKFNGLIETLDECIKYPVCYTSHEDSESGDVILAGPTCDSVDIMYEDHKYQLPMDMKMGERLYWLSAGAYTSSYASVGFNGFPPLKVYCI